MLLQENPDDRPLISSVVFNLENGCTSLPAPNLRAYFTRHSMEIEQLRDAILNSVNSVTLTEIEGR